MKAILRAGCIPLLIVLLTESSTARSVECLEKGKAAFKQVVDAVYSEMGEPELTQDNVEKLDRALFMREIDKEPAFYKHANTSWSEYRNSITGGVSCLDGDEMVALRFIWRPGKPLEMIPLDAVLKW